MMNLMENIAYAQCCLAIDVKCQNTFFAFKRSVDHVASARKGLQENADVLFLEEHEREPVHLSFRCRQKLVVRTVNAYLIALKNNITPGSEDKIPTIGSEETLKVTLDNACCDQSECDIRLYEIAILKSII